MKFRPHPCGLLDCLLKLDGTPWSQQYDGRLLNASKLAQELRFFKVKPGPIKIYGINKNGYRRDDFNDAFRRYLKVDPTPLPISQEQPTTHNKPLQATTCEGGRGVESTLGTISDREGSLPPFPEQGYEEQREVFEL